MADVTESEVEKLEMVAEMEPRMEKLVAEMEPRVEEMEDPGCNPHPSTLISRFE